MSTTTTTPTGSAKAGAHNVTGTIPKHADDALRIPVRETAPLADTRPLPRVEELDDAQFEMLKTQVEIEASERSPESRGERMFLAALDEKEELAQRLVANAKEALVIISAAITTYADRIDSRVKIVQDYEPLVNHARERVEMTTKVRSLRFVRGTYIVWVSLSDDADATCGIVLRRRWKDPVYMTASGFPELLDKLAWHFSLASRR